MGKNLHQNLGVEYITFELFDNLNIKHAFSTKKGGVSSGDCATMNLSFCRGDKREDVFENHKRFAKTLGYDYRNLVFSDQIHETVIRSVCQEDCGKGITKKSDIIGVDGLVTNEKNVVLMTFYADCVPLFFADTKKGVVGMAHSGWRGTVAHIGQKMVEKMEQEYQCEKEDIYVVIGPSICQDCYEVSEDVILEFKKQFQPPYDNKLFYIKENGKYQLNLWEANRRVLLGAGILNEHLECSELCTCCNSKQLFSHRATSGKRGNLAGVIWI